jgi:hypothetical protein
MQLKRAANLLREFYYEKNGKEETIEFLIFILNELVNGKESDYSE